MFVFCKGKISSFNIEYIDSSSYHLDWAVNHSYQRSKNGSKKKINPVKNKKKKKHNIWEYKIGRRQHSDVSEIAFQHPATFPEQLANDHIVSWSNENDIVYDPFMGSGTTAKMAHLQKRRWIGSEMSKEYVDLAKKRIAPYLSQTTLF
jgi:site-specific DNA-methyltransferase (adenine-specific)